MKPQITKNNKGFSLIELMIAMAIFVVIVGLIVDNYIQQESQSVTQNQVVEIQQNARAGLYMIAREIRMAGYDPWEDSGARILSAGTGSNGSPLTFTYVADNDNNDNNGDGTTDEPGELRTIAIQLFDSSIDSNLPPPFDNNDEIHVEIPVGAGLLPEPIADNIAALQFIYFDEDGNPPSSNSKIRSIQVTLTARADESERNLIGNNRALVAMVKCRNLGL
ncbi:MAG: prepilin-type N-terminal cleavage/methylation domain-containing protein [Desulfobacteraceae bacterium]|nr:prepilin-type N-terminal cleavage/methylation domain-containing protein [Desulfobacteraceae bacterium]